MGKVKTTATETTSNTVAIKNMDSPTTADMFINPDFAEEAKKRNKAIKAELGKISNSLEKIAFNIYWFYANKGFEQLGYKTIDELAQKEYGIKRTTTYDYINVVERFAERDENGNIIERIRADLKDFQSSKLIALTNVNDEQLAEFDASMSVREIKSKVKELLDSDNETSCEADNDSSTDSKDEVIDVEATEVNRQVIISFSNIEEYNSYLDSMNDLIEKNLKSMSFKKDGNKKIEIAIAW